MPHFLFVEESRVSIARRTGRGMVLLFVPTFLLAGLSAWRLRRFRGV